MEMVLVVVAELDLLAEGYTVAAAAVPVVPVLVESAVDLNMWVNCLAMGVEDYLEHMDTPFPAPHSDNNWDYAYPRVFREGIHLDRSTKPNRRYQIYKLGCSERRHINSPRPFLQLGPYSPIVAG